MKEDSGHGVLMTVVTFCPGRSVLPDGSAVPKASEFAARGLALACSEESLAACGVRLGEDYFSLTTDAKLSWVEGANALMAERGGVLGEPELGAMAKEAALAQTPALLGSLAERRGRGAAGTVAGRPKP